MNSKKSIKPYKKTNDKKQPKPTKQEKSQNS